MDITIEYQDVRTGSRKAFISVPAEGLALGMFQRKPGDFLQLAVVPSVMRRGGIRLDHIGANTSGGVREDPESIG